MATVVLPEPTRALYPFRSHFVTLSDGQQMHYLDEGPAEGEALVFVHGYPTWSFAYRALLVYYAARGYRCIALDHVGFGLSDKPTSKRYHTLRRTILNLLELITTLDLHDITLIAEDWGGPVALGYTIRRKANVRRLVLMNTWGFREIYPLRMERLIRLATAPGVGRLLFQTLNIAPGLLLQRETTRQLTPAVISGYRTPFRDPRSRTALVQFPRMISFEPDHASTPDMRELERGLPELDAIPALLLWGEKNPVFVPDVAQRWKQYLPGVRGPHVLRGAGHLLPEDDPEGVIAQVDTFLAETGAAPQETPP